MTGAIVAAHPEPADENISPAEILLHHTREIHKIAVAGRQSGASNVNAIELARLAGQLAKVCIDSGAEELVQVRTDVPLKIVETMFEAILTVWLRSIPDQEYRWELDKWIRAMALTIVDQAEKPDDLNTARYIAWTFAADNPPPAPPSMIIDVEAALTSGDETPSQPHLDPPIAAQAPAQPPEPTTQDVPTLVEAAVVESVPAPRKPPARRIIPADPRPEDEVRTGPTTTRQATIVGEPEPGPWPARQRDDQVDEVEPAPARRRFSPSNHRVMSPWGSGAAGLAPHASGGGDPSPLTRSGDIPMG